MIMDVVMMVTMVMPGLLTKEFDMMLGPIVIFIDFMFIKVVETPILRVELRLLQAVMAALA